MSISLVICKLIRKNACGYITITAITTYSLFKHVNDATIALHLFTVIFFTWYQWIFFPQNFGHWFHLFRFSVFIQLLNNWSAMNSQYVYICSLCTWKTTIISIETDLMHVPYRLYPASISTLNVSHKQEPWQNLRCSVDW